MRSPLGDASIACRAMDARMLAAMGAAFKLEPDLPASQSQRDLKELQIARQALIKDRTRLMNRLETQTLAFTSRQTTLRLNQIARQITDPDCRHRRRDADPP